MKVAIYCSSQSNLPAEVIEGAKDIAAAIGEAGGELVYGGVNAGLMHTVAEAAHRAGAKVTGVIPDVFRHRGDDLCDEMIYTADLNERKERMIDMADIFVVLPGGIGTLDEWISTLSHIMVKEKTDPNADRPILVWNHESMYDGMARQLTATDRSVYARGRRVDRSLLFPDASSLAAHLRTLLRP